MSVLEFIAAIKWPVTVLILAFTAGRWWHRSPEARTTFRSWIEGRNIRLSVAGQQLEATLADAQRTLIAATGSDDELAQAEPESTADEDEGDRSHVSVTMRRREAVEAVLRSAATLGWEAAGGSRPTPYVQVSWSPEGEPSIVLREVPNPNYDSPWFSAEGARPAGVTLPHAHAWLRGPRRSRRDISQMSFFPEEDEAQRSTDDDGTR